MIQSLFVYGIGSLLLYFLGVVSISNSSFVSIKTRKSSFYSFSVLFSILLFSFIYAARWNVGVDHLTYVKEYNYYSIFGTFIRDSFEIGFEFFTSIFALNSIHFFWFFFFAGILLITPIYFFSRKFSFIYPYLGPIIILGTSFLNWSNGMRQNIAACITVLAFSHLVNRRVVRFILIVLIASLFHRSAIVLLIFYIIPFDKFKPGRLLLLIIYFYSLFLGQNSYWINVLSNLGDLLNLIGYDFYTDSIDYFIKDDSESRNFGVRSITLLLIDLSIIWFYPILTDKYKAFNYDLIFKLSFVGMFIVNIFKNSHHIFIRPSYYFIIYNIFTSAFLMHYLVKNFKYKRSPSYILIIMIILSYCILTCYSELNSTIKSYSNYNFFWDFN